MAETAWSGTGGGVTSLYLPQPGYQRDLPIPLSGFRGNPDVAYNADPTPGFAVYTTTPFDGERGSFAVGGTSAGAPQWAALTALANELRTAGNLSTNNLFRRPQYTAAAGPAYTDNYRDITVGTNGTCSFVCQAGPGSTT